MVVQKELDGTLRVSLNNGVVFWAIDWIDLEAGLMEIALIIQLNKFNSKLK